MKACTSAESVLASQPITGAKQVHAWVFRDNKARSSGPLLLKRLERALNDVLAKSGDVNLVLDALLLSGEAETALSDVADAAESLVAQITDGFADLLSSVSGKQQLRHLQLLLAALARTRFPENLWLSAPEGFAYYALHPLDFANCAVRIANSLNRQASSVADFAIVGIRNIGTVLSAVSAAALKKNQYQAERITVRPAGHPYDRVTNFGAGQLAWIQQQLKRAATFLVTDEGPGLSGSSFLSVGEALLEAGVPLNRIHFLGTREPESTRLCSPNGAQRWARFHLTAVEGSKYSQLDGSDISAGKWRKIFLPNESHWPGSWTHMERVKALCADRKSILKFDGLGRWGDAVRARSHTLAAAGFSPNCENAGNGLTRYELCSGDPMSSKALSTDVLRRIAEYCSFRARECAKNGSNGSEVTRRNGEALAEMMRFNAEQELGVALDIKLGHFTPERVVVPDGRMQPYEWIRNATGIMKVDGATHGDDHFFPGPTDIAWDIAGAIIEWEMDSDAEQFLLDEFHKRLGIRVRQRIGQYLLAYSLFRTSYCRMAANAVSDPMEKERLWRDHLGYRERARLQLQRPAF